MSLAGFVQRVNAAGGLATRLGVDATTPELRGNPGCATMVVGATRRLDDYAHC